ncbi:MAG: CPBP family intramembrane glutamic endopeptidase [Acidobacteriota bacterium]
MLQRLTPRAELLLVNLICFGPFAARSLIELGNLRSVIVFDESRALFILGIEIVCGTLAGLLLRARGWTPAKLGLRVSMPQTIAGMLLLIGTNLFIAGFYELVQVATGTDPGGATTPVTHMTWPVLIALTLINPLYDELFVVAYNIQASQNSGAAFAITLSAAIRFLCHLDQGPIAAVTILPLGIIFALVYWRWRLVWPLVVAHGVMDFLGLMPG